MSVHDVFREYCNRWGLTPATTENTHETTLQVCGAFMRFFETQCRTFEREVRGRYGKGLQVALGFCADSSLNAFADRHRSNTYVIGIHTGAIATLANTLVDLFTKSPRLCERMRLGVADASFPRHGILANTALFAATHFLFSHELGHIAYGHTDLSREANHLLVEAGSSAASSGIEADLLQSMEVDADLHASTSVIAHVAKGQLCGIPMKDSLESRTDLLQLTLISVLVMFHMFYGPDVTLSIYRAQSHPLPEVRLLKFVMRASQMQSGLPEGSFGSDVNSPIIDDVASWVPSELRNVVFPALKLEGGVNLAAEAARIRANEDRYEKRLAEHTIIPVGGIVV